MSSPEGKKIQLPKRLNMKLRAVSLCQLFPNTSPDYWISGISKVEIAEIESALGMIQNSSVGDPLVDITSEKNVAIHNFKTACKWIWHFHGEDVLPPKKDTPDAE